jgi:hypothetical protein
MRWSFSIRSPSDRHFRMLVRLSRQIPVRKRKHNVQTLPHSAWRFCNRILGLKFPVDECHISSAHRKKLIVSIVLELYCACCNSYNCSILREYQQETSPGLGTNTNLISVCAIRIYGPSKTESAISGEEDNDHCFLHRNEINSLKQPATSSIIHSGFFYL